MDTPSLVIHGCAPFIYETFYDHLFTLPSQRCRWECAYLALEGTGECLEDLGRRCSCEVRSFRLHLTVFVALTDRSYREEPGHGHWYSSVFRNPRVKAFLDFVLDEERPPPRRSTATFTLTAAVPADSGSLHGWRILTLLAPGRCVTQKKSTIILPGEQYTHAQHLIPECSFPFQHQIGAFIGRNGRRHGFCRNVQRRVLQRRRHPARRGSTNGHRRMHARRP